MFHPNLPCRIQVSAGNDVYGHPLPSTYYRERCAIVKLIVSTEKTSVRADSSASRGNAKETQADAMILLTTRTHARIGDIIDVAGHKLLITSLFPRHDVNGRLDHYEVTAQFWRTE